MNKQQQFDRFLDLLGKAMPCIEEKYMRFGAVGLLDGFMERTYVYELHHQLRKFQDDLEYNDFVIHAEPEKARTEFLRKIRERIDSERPTDRFQKRVMPDLLVHVPNNINANIAIVEIKPEKGRPNAIPSPIMGWRKAVQAGE